ncbi:hypothetical protein J7E97_11790 [Streptomyces sp. ISL-66]|uniref:hypothetical protein n=1 Tax=Streptomyces sp. ISL-66 TaxID=2819186 RepID=UPI001BE83597|nr:hypothetical protein [Streptomyces sp. ISL-66]MBT2468540.1 hypothetical protein [Streptomyces sp. ISL-66]
MQLLAHPAMIRIRTRGPAVAEIAYAVGSLWTSASVLHHWPDPLGYWRDTDTLAHALAAVHPPVPVPVPVSRAGHAG